MTRRGCLLLMHVAALLDGTSNVTDFLTNPAMSSGGCQLIRFRAFIGTTWSITTDHLYGICQQELLKLLAAEVKSRSRGGRCWQELQVSLFSICLLRKKKNLQSCDFLTRKKSPSLLATMHFTKRHKLFSLKTGFHYDKETAEEDT